MISLKPILFLTFAETFAMNNWKKLYQLADCIKALKPWRFMYEDEIMGVRDPITGSIGFISVMGRLGNHLSVTVYMGEVAFGQFLEIKRNPEATDFAAILETPQLMLSFEDRDSTDKQDRAVMKEVGAKYSGKTSWPLFRCYRPGLVPWFLEEQEQLQMIWYLEQFLAIRVGVEAKSSRFQAVAGDQDKILVREFRKSGEKYEWYDTFQKITIPTPAKINFPIESNLLEKAKKVSVGKGIFEIDFFLTPAQIKEKKSRPYFLYLFLVVDRKSQMVIHNEPMNPSEGIDVMLSQLPGLFLNVLTRGTTVPGAVYTPSVRLAALLAPLLNNFGIKIHYQQKLKSLDMVKTELMDFFLNQ